MPLRAMRESRRQLQGMLARPLTLSQLPQPQLGQMPLLAALWRPLHSQMDSRESSQLCR